MGKVVKGFLSHHLDLRDRLWGVIGKIWAKENDGKTWELCGWFKCANSQAGRQLLVSLIHCVCRNNVTKKHSFKNIYHFI